MIAERNFPTIESAIRQSTVTAPEVEVSEQVAIHRVDARAFARKQTKPNNQFHLCGGSVLQRIPLLCAKEGGMVHETSVRRQNVTAQKHFKLGNGLRSKESPHAVFPETSDLERNICRLIWLKTRSAKTKQNICHGLVMVQSVTNILFRFQKPPGFLFGTIHSHNVGSNGCCG